MLTPIGTLSRTASVTLVLASLLFGTPTSASRSMAQDAAFDVNDLSFLWPPPTTDEEVRGLIAADEASADGRRIWPPAVFKTLIDTAQKVKVAGSVSTAGINFNPFKAEFENPATWKIVSFRVDPSAPGGHAGFVKQFGSTPQVRIVFQPVTKVGPAIRVHDVTAHLAFSYVQAPAPGAPLFPAAANKDLFGQIVADLKALRQASAAGGAATAGVLRVHPGLQARVPGFAAKVKTFLQQRTAQGALNELAFMGIQPPEPWIFFSMRKNAAGAYDLVQPKVIGGQSAQMLFLLDPARVMPTPQSVNFPPQGGVSTAPLFRGGDDVLAKPVFSGGPRPAHSDIPDIVANPTFSHVLNTDCVSCHSESTRRVIRKLGDGDGMFRYARPAGISGVEQGLVPKTDWNVRNFGWFQPTAGDKTLPTISMRTANEAAEAAHFTNREYLAVPGVAPHAGNGNGHGGGSAPLVQDAVASPLTLVMNIKSPADFLALKKKLDHMQSLPRDQNPIIAALDQLRTVHFARFVFLGERQLAVITTYDGSFEDYIDAFVNAIGKIFDEILVHIADAPPLSVQKPENRKAFLEYVKKHDLKGLPPFYSAYPQLGVLDILSLQKKAGGQ